MNTMTHDQIIRMLELLRDAQGTAMDHMILWADTNSECAILYNPHMDGGRWEMHMLRYDEILTAHEDIGMPLVDGEDIQREYTYTDIEEMCEWIMVCDEIYIGSIS